MGKKVFTKEDVETLASHMSPVLDALIEAKKKENLNKLKIFIWEDDELWMEALTSESRWRIVKGRDVTGTKVIMIEKET